MLTWTNNFSFVYVRGLETVGSNDGLYWGNTQMSSGILAARTPGTGLQLTTKPTELSSSSGYMADSSSKTPGIFLREKMTNEPYKESADEKSFIGTKVQIPGKVSKVSQEPPKPTAKFCVAAPKKVRSLKCNHN